MFDKSLSFIDVQRILLAIGFRRGTVPPEDAGTPVAQTVFIHDRTDTLFAFPATTVTIDTRARRVDSPDPRRARCGRRRRHRWIARSRRAYDRGLNIGPSAA